MLPSAGTDADTAEIATNVHECAGRAPLDHPRVATRSAARPLTDTARIEADVVAPSCDGSSRLWSIVDLAQTDASTGEVSMAAIPTGVVIDDEGSVVSVRSKIARSSVGIEPTAAQVGELHTLASDQLDRVVADGRCACPCSIG